MGIKHVIQKNQALNKGGLRGNDGALLITTIILRKSI